MKNIIITLAMMLSFSFYASAETNPVEDWKEKMLSQKIAYLTVELGITPEEAQVFWPVYNEVQKDQDEAMHNVFRTFMELEKAVKAKKPEKEISKFLDDYHKAMQVQIDVEKKTIEKYKKALPVEKLAKLYIAEEKFRRQQIQNLAHPKPRPNR